MRRRIAFLGLVAVAICTVVAGASCTPHDPTCPTDAPTTGVPLTLPPAPHWTPPLACGYLDRCGEIVCVDKGDGTWSCHREDEGGPCDGLDASGDADHE